MQNKSAGASTDAPAHCFSYYMDRATKRAVGSSRGGTRTPDTVINSHLLYHLSYSGMSPKPRRATEQGQASARGLRVLYHGYSSAAHPRFDQPTFPDLRP